MLYNTFTNIQVLYNCNTINFQSAAQIDNKQTPTYGTHTNSQTGDRYACATNMIVAATTMLESTKHMITRNFMKYIVILRIKVSNIGQFHHRYSPRRDCMNDATAYAVFFAALRLLGFAFTGAAAAAADALASSRDCFATCA